MAEHFSGCLCFPVGFLLKLFDLSKDHKIQNKGEPGTGLPLQDHFSSQAKNLLNLNFVHHIGNIFRGPSVKGRGEVASPWLWWIDFLCLVTGRGHLCITLSLGLGILFHLFIYLFIYFFCRNSNMTSAKRWLNCLHVSQLAVSFDLCQMSEGRGLAGGDSCALGFRSGEI